MKNTDHKEWYEFIDDDGRSFYVFIEFKTHDLFEERKWVEIEFYNFEPLKKESRPILRISTSFEGFNEMIRDGERLCTLRKIREGDIEGESQKAVTKKVSLDKLFWSKRDEQLFY